MLAVAALASSLFPLAPGHRWTFRDVDSGTKIEMSVRQDGRLHGFPGTDVLRVRRRGQTVQVRDRRDQRWENLFRFGAKVGASYRVRLAGYVLWESVRVRAASKTAAVLDYRGHVHRGCTRFEFGHLTPVADVGLLEMAFCPRVGLLRFSETTIGGPRTFALASFR